MPYPAPLPLLLVEPGGRVVRANEAALAHLGLARDAVDGQDVGALGIDAGGGELLRELVARGAAGTARGEVEGRAAGGAVRVAEVAAGPDGTGHVVVALWDVTERALRDRRKGALVGEISHELRTPITAIRGALGLVEAGHAGRVDPKAQDLIRVARTNVDRLARVVTDAVDLERLESGMVPLAVGAVDASDLVARAVDLMVAIATQRGVRLRAVVQATTEVEADADRSALVLANFVSAALRHAPDGAMLEVTARPAAGFVRFAVEDAAGRLPAAARELARERLDGIDAAPGQRRAGTGLGLALSRAVLEQQGGRLGIGAAGEAALFWMELPVA